MQGRLRVTLLVGAAVVLAGCAGPPSPFKGSAGPEAGLIVHLDAPSTGEVGNDLGFKAAVEGEAPGKLFFFWDFGDGGRASDVNLTEIQHAYAASGAYGVRLLVVDTRGRQGEASAQVGITGRAFFEGTVSETEPLEIGSPEFEGGVPVRPSALRLVGEVALTRPDGPVALLLGQQSTVTIHLSTPDGALAHEAEVAVPPDGSSHTFQLEAERWSPDGNATFQVAALSGIVHFEADLALHYVAV